jgi:fatty-acyl-CoA synthase
VRIEEQVTIAARRDRVWELIRDPAAYADLLDWVTTFEPHDDQRGPGIGARYDMLVQVGSANVGGLVEIVEYDPLRDIVWTSVTGVDQHGRLRLRTERAELTRLMMRISYGAPGALLGTLAELLSVPQVRASIKRSLENVKREAEGTERPPPRGPSLPARLLHEIDNAWILAKSGMVAPMRPDRAARIALIATRWGVSPAAGVLVGAVRHPNRSMVIDDFGSLNYSEVDRRSNAVANALRARGIEAGDRVGLMCRDHRGFVEAVLAVGKLGADVLVLNTSFAASQLTEACRGEDATALICDAEFAELTTEAARGRRRFVVWHEHGSQPESALEDSIREVGDAALAPPGRTGRITILTGTTSTPTGAFTTSTPRTLDPAAALLERLPLREGQVVRFGAPLLHAWGLFSFELGMALGATFVLRRAFDPEQCLVDIQEHRCEALIVVAAMLRRILELPGDVRRRYDTSSLRAVCASGSAPAGDLAIRWMDEFGENLYSVYGSTELPAATLATPRDTRRAPGTAGKPTRGSIVRLFNEHGRPVLQGQTGRIFVGNAMLLEPHMSGDRKDHIDGLMATGDLGRFDEAGRLFVRAATTR